MSNLLYSSYCQPFLKMINQTCNDNNCMFMVKYVFSESLYPSSHPSMYYHIYMGVIYTQVSLFVNRKSQLSETLRWNQSYTFYMAL